MNWIWYPGDFEIYHGMLQNFQREERGYGWPAYWKMDDWRKNVCFSRDYELERDSRFVVHAQGVGYVAVDGRKYSFERDITCPAGKHKIEIYVGNMAALPCACVEGDVIHSTPEWMADDFRECRAVGYSPLYTEAEPNPNQIPWRYVPCKPVSKREVNGGVLFDFGRMINGSLKIITGDKAQTVTVAYGESEAEALDLKWCYYKEENTVDGMWLRKRAFRYVYIPEGSTETMDCEAVHEEFPLEVRASFHCDDALLNRIWDISVETFRLCSGLFFIDGIKRDRWIWSGDAYQSYFVNQYLFFDEEINKRTIRALRGNTEITQHLNTIVDYSMLWVIGLENHYWMTGDADFLAEMYPKLEAMMALLMKQTNELGFIYGRERDWIYIDWAEMDKDGVLCAEQILLWKCCRVMDDCGKVLGKPDAGWADKAAMLKANILHYFWNEEKQAFIDTYESGRNNVTRHANIFAILFGLVEADKTEAILDHVLLNDAIPAITTPYFKFFELDMWGKLGRLDIIWEALHTYWGGMVEKGAVTFWEQYDPTCTGKEHYAMYGDPFGKSLCHAWSASPIYLIGRYFLGVKPLEPGYTRYDVAPHVEFFKELHCVVPIRNGSVRIDKENGRVNIQASRE